MNIGILFALVALVSWGVGDFLMQKSSRAFGNWVAIFFITTFGAVAMFPFVHNEVRSLLSSGRGLPLLLLTSIILLFVALVQLEAYKRGKLSVIEPILAFEVPVAAMLAAVVVHEHISGLQISLIASLLVGVVLVSIQSFKDLRTITWEAGIVYAVLATFGLGIENLLFGMSSRETSPLLINWFTSFFLSALSLVFLIGQRRVTQLKRIFVENKKLIMWVSIFDNSAWLAYSYSTLYVPIAIATSVSETYVALAVVLGIALNGERIEKHQMTGIIIAIASVIALSAISG